MKFTSFFLAIACIIIALISNVQAEPKKGKGKKASKNKKIKAHKTTPKFRKPNSDHEKKKVYKEKISKN